MNLIQSIFDKIFSLHEKIFNVGQKTKDLILCIYMVVFNLYYIMVMSNMIQMRSAYKAVIHFILVLGLIFILKPQNKIQIPKIKKHFSFALWILFIGLSIISCVINVSLNIIATVPLIFFLFFNIYSGNELIKHLRPVSIAAVISLLFLWIINMVSMPIQSAQYYSKLNSPIGLCMYITTLLPFVFYLIENIRHLLLKYLLILFVAVNLTYIVYSASRTGLVCAICIVGVWVAYLIFNFKGQAMQTILKIACMAVCIFICLNTILPIHNHVYKYANQIFSSQSQPSIPDSEISPGDSLDTFEDRIGFDGKDLNQISAGRIDIWKEYVSHFNLTGHKDTTDITVTVDYKDETFQSISAHNTFIQVIYDYGLIAGGVFLIVVVIGFLKCGYFCIMNRKDYKSFLLLSIVGNFIAVGMFNSTFYYYNYINLMYFILILSSFLLVKKCDFDTI